MANIPIDGIVITVSGMEALNLQVGDSIDMHNGTIYTITKVESATKLHVRRASKWVSFRWWFMDMTFEVKLYYWQLKRAINEALKK